MERQSGMITLLTMLGLVNFLYTIFEKLPVVFTFTL